jgi:hypothetical protein
MDNKIMTRRGKGWKNVIDHTSLKIHKFEDLEDNDQKQQQKNNFPPIEPFQGTLWPRSARQKLGVKMYFFKVQARYFVCIVTLFSIWRLKKIV